MWFIAIMFLTTSCVAGAAAFFSVYGLAHTFQATFWSVVFMGGSLEAGKLMITSYLYRFRETMSWGRKFLGVAFVFGLMMITSLGIYGYLADAYQAGSTNKKQVDTSLTLKREEQSNLQKRKAEIDTQISRVPDKDTRGKQRLITQFGPEVNTINKRLMEITTELQQDAQKQIATDSHVGPIVFIAKIVGLDPDKAMSYFILMIIFLFDPVAIYLTVATNEAIAKYKRKTETPADEAKLVAPYNPADIMEDFYFGHPASTVEVVEQDTHPESTGEFVEVPEVDLPVMDLEAFKQKCMDNLYISTPTVEPRKELPPLEYEVVQEFQDEPWRPKAARPRSELVTEDYISPPPGTGKGSLVETLPQAPFEQTFSAHSADEVEPEEETVPADALEEIKDIYQDITSKETQTPLDKEAVKMIERFFARQNLVKDVRTGNFKH